MGGVQLWAAERIHQVLFGGSGLLPLLSKGQDSDHKSGCEHSKVGHGVSFAWVMAREGPSGIDLGLDQVYDLNKRMIEAIPTKDRILDSAEKLFGLNGFESTSLREITADAGANLASVNYHFQTKDSLINAVIGRRIGPINRRRLEMLAAAGETASVEQILEALIRPPLELELGPLMPLMGRILSNPRDLEQLYRDHFAPVARKFWEALGHALPHLAGEELVWRQQFTVGTLTHLLIWGPSLANVTGGVCSMDNREAAIARAVAFLAAGFRSAPPLLEKI